MAGQIVHRGPGRWVVRIYRGRDAAGKRRYHNKTIHGTKRDAERYRTKILRELDTGTFVEASQRTLEDFLKEWLEVSVRPRVRQRTHQDYSSLAARYLIPSLGHLRLSQLSPGDIQRVYADLQERGLSPRTIRYTHSVLYGGLEQAVKWRMLARNPAKLVDLPRQSRREMRVLGPEQAARFLEAARSDRWYALWTVLLTTGLRPGEALALKWSDLDGDRLRVQRSLVRDAGGGWHLAEPKSARARRVVSLPATSLRVLQAHRKQQLEERLGAGEQWEDHDLVFASSTGQPLDFRVAVRRHFKPLLKRAGLPSIRPYDLRHTCATLLLAAGENVKVVSERLGHASATLTLDVYSHVLPDMQQRAAERIEGLLFG